MSLLPSRGPDVSTAQEGEMQVVGVDEEVEPLLDALSSETARAVLNEIYDDPGTPSQIADRLDMSIQKVSYHLDKLEDQELIAVAGTRYSEKGQEMKVFEPPEEPLVLFVGTQERKSSLKTLVKRVLPSIGILAVASVAVQRFFDQSGGAGGGFLSSASDDAAGRQYEAADAEETEPAPAAEESVDDVELAEGPADSTTETPESTGTPTEIPDETLDTSAQATEAITGTVGPQLSPGIAFFLGGLLVITVLVGFWAYQTYA